MSLKFSTRMETLKEPVLCLGEGTPAIIIQGDDRGPIQVDEYWWKHIHQYIQNCLKTLTAAVKEANDNRVNNWADKVFGSVEFPSIPELSDPRIRDNFETVMTKLMREIFGFVNIDLGDSFRWAFTGTCES